MIFAWKWLPESKPPRAAGEVHAPRPIWHATWQVIRHPQGPVPRLTWIYAAGMLGFTAMTSVLALYMDLEFGVTEKTIGYVFFYVATLSLVMRSILLGPIVRRIGEPSPSGGTVLLALGLSVSGLASLWVVRRSCTGADRDGLAVPRDDGAHVPLHERARLVRLWVRRRPRGSVPVVAPLMATSAFQRFGSPAPFYLAGVIVMLVGVLAFRLDVAAHTLRQKSTG